LEAEEAAESVESRRASSPLATWRTSMNQRPSSEEMYRWRHEPAVLQCTGSYTKRSHQRQQPPLIGQPSLLSSTRSALPTPSSN
jgi:hypothetical protein